VLVDYLKELSQRDVAVKGYDIVNLTPTECFLELFSEFSQHEPVIIEAAGLNPDLFFVFRHQDGGSTPIMVLKADISALLEAFIAPLSFEHFVEDIW
jgi:hypothetical protein